MNCNAHYISSAQEALATTVVSIRDMDAGERAFTDEQSRNMQLWLGCSCRNSFTDDGGGV